MNATAISSVRDYATLAQERLPEPVWRYLSDGDGGENERALAAARVMPRPLADVRGGNTRLTLFGQPLEHPILLAPISYQRLFHPEGESACAAAAAAQGGQIVVSSLSSQSFSTVAKASRNLAGSAPWFQLYWQGDRIRTERLLDRAMTAGLSAVVFTVDAPVKRATFELPASVHAVNLDEEDAMSSVEPGRSVVFDGWMAKAPTWDDVAWLRTRLSDRPLVLKGLLHPDDAEHALDLGCDAVVVSNHGQRVLAAAPSSLEMLARIVRRIGGRMPILFDGGVRSGADAFIALALGATAVLIGRPCVWGLAVEGALGVARVIRLLRDELEMTMALAGCARLSEISRDCLLVRAGGAF